MAIADIRKTAEQKMQKSLETLKTDLAKVRTGRAHTGLLDHVHVDYYGSPTALSQVANVTLVDARTIGVQPWEKKMVSVVEKAIRNLRRDANNHVKEELKAKTISEDDARGAQDDMQKLTDRHIVEIDRMVTQKEAEIMTV